MHFSLVSLILFSSGLIGSSDGRSIQPNRTVQIECNPFPRVNTSQYIIAYGSLMQTASKNRTNPGTGENIPVVVKGYRREWNLKGTEIGVSTTYLGVVEDSCSTFNGAIFLLPWPKNESASELLSRYDEREKYYCRQEVKLEDMEILDKNSKNTIKLKGQSQFWVYVNKPVFTAYPSQEFPIVQSYVDIFICGCFELEKNFNLTGFSENCVDSTKRWSSSWVNDRIYPRRPFIYQPKATQIDKILFKKIPIIFRSIKIGG